MSTKKITQVMNPGTIFQAIFADLAAVIRVAQAGLDWKPVGAIGSAVRVTENTPILIYNSAGAVGYIAFGAQTMAAPSGPTDGIPILAGQTFVVNSGSLPWIRGSASTLYAYVGDN